MKYRASLGYEVEVAEGYAQDIVSPNEREHLT
jgi:hypothetical protein